MIDGGLIAFIIGCAFSFAAGYFIGYAKGMFAGIVTHVVIEDPLDVIYPKKEKEVER